MQKIRSLLTAVLIITGVFSGLPGLTVPSAAAAPVAGRFEPTRCRYALPRGYVEGKDAECGYVVTPMWTDGRTDETVRLFTVHFFATGANPAPEPLILLNGGPGGTVADQLSWFDPAYDFFGPMLERQDIIAFDQRGIGESRPSLLCPSRSGPTHKADPDGNMLPGPMRNRQSIVNPQRALVQCENRLEDRGLDLSAFIAERSASDIAAIASAFHAPKVDLYGVSYGTRLGLFAMRDHPEILRSVILSSIDAPATHGFKERITGLDSALRQIFADCEADQECRQTYPDLEGSFQIDVADLADEPRTIHGEDFDQFPFDVTVTADDFLYLLYESINSSWLIPNVPDLINSMAEGDDSVLAAMVPLVFGSDGGSVIDLVFDTHICQDEVPFASRQEMEALEHDPSIMPEIRKYFAPQMVDAAYDSCAVLHFTPSAPSANGTITSDVPTLLITGALDPNTPITNTELVASTLSNATEVVYANGGHGPEYTDKSCSVPILEEFLDNPGSSLDADCAATPPEFTDY